MVNVRAAADRRARERLAGELGELILAADPAAVESDWAARYVRYWYEEYAYQSAIVACDGDTSLAATVVADPEIQAEIELRVEQMSAGLVRRAA